MKRWEQVKVDITFIMNTRSSKWWRGGEICQHLNQLGHEECSARKISWIMTEMCTAGYVERVRVKPQWSLYSYRLKKMYVNNHPKIVQRDASNILW